MKKVNKKIILILIILISILAIILLFNKLNIIENLQNTLAGNRAYEQEDGISYTLYDNQSEKLKVMVIITRKDGIDSVERLDGNDNMTINCDGRTTLALDLNAEVNKEYRFKVISNGIEETESVIIPENYLEQYFEFTLDEENKIGLEYFNHREDETITNYYKIGTNTAIWQPHTEDTENINLTLANMDEVGASTATVYAKQVDSIGDTIIDKRVYNLPTSGDFDIFANCVFSGKTLNEYGFSALSGSFRAFDAYNIYGGKSTGRGNWSCSFRLNFSTSKINELNARQLDIEFHLFGTASSSGKASTSGASATLYYTDGTYESLSIPQAEYRSSTLNLTFDLDATKQISYVDMSFYGYDGWGGSSYARMQNIMLKGVEL